MDTFLIVLQIAGFLASVLSAWLTVVIWRETSHKEQFEDSE
jgi:hypothetical protein